MSELVEEGPGIVEAQERWSALPSLREVQGINDDGEHLSVQPLLFAKSAHPGAASLRRPVEVVPHEKGNHLAFAVQHLPDADVRVIDRYVAALVETKPEKPMRRVERRRDHVIQLEIRLQSRSIDIEFGLPAFLGVVVPIPGGQRLIMAFRLRQAFQRFALLAGPKPGSVPNPL